MQTLKVDLGDRSYPIYIGSGLLQQKELIQTHIQGKTTAIVSNKTIAPLYLEALHQTIESYKNTDIILPDGEKYKTLETEQQIFTQMLSAHCDRKTTLLALGGGVVGVINVVLILSKFQPRYWQWWIPRLEGKQGLIIP